jgi:hypothetical protein
MHHCYVEHARLSIQGLFLLPEILDHLALPKLQLAAFHDIRLDFGEHALVLSQDVFREEGPLGLFEGFVKQFLCDYVVFIQLLDWVFYRF